jgi:hypothetical protein
LWLVEDRPHPKLETGCAGFDDYKFGLGGKFVGYASDDAERLGRDGLVDRYMKRKVHYAWGLVCLLQSFGIQLLTELFLQQDHGPGDTRCQALVSTMSFTDATRPYIHNHLQTQGATHLERGQNFDKMLHNIGMSDAQTIDYIPGASHKSTEMIFSKGGFDKACSWKPLSGGNLNIEF